MRVDLSRDPLFGKIQSPVKQLKDKRLEKEKQLRIQRMNPSLNEKRIDSHFEVIDPLPEQLKQYREETTIKKIHQNSKATKALKKYIIEQERNLKSLRMERIQNERSVKTSRTVSSTFHFDQETSKSRHPGRQIHIPKIGELFHNQEKQYVLYESRMMKSKLSNAINSIDNGLNYIQNKYFLKTLSLPKKEGKKVGSVHEISNEMLPKNVSEVHISDQDLQLNQLIERKFKRSENLRKKLYEQKRMMLSNQIHDDSKGKTGLFYAYKEKPKKKIKLEGIKKIPIHHNNKTIQITPASSLLFQLNNAYKGKDKKQQQLSGLLKNSYQNRQDILFEKSRFYDGQTNFKDLSPSSQFKLRRQMNHRLDNRLLLSREQVSSFKNFIEEIKNQFHVILNGTMLQILEEIRESLISGKVMKKSDFVEILRRKEKEELEGKTNELIISKLHEMMV